MLPDPVYTGSCPWDGGIDSSTRLQLDRNEVNEALILLLRKAKVIGPAAMEVLTVDAPPDCIRPLESMERDGAEDRADAREH